MSRGVGDLTRGGDDGRLGGYGPIDGDTCGARGAGGGAGAGPHCDCEGTAGYADRRDRAAGAKVGGTAAVRGSRATGPAGEFEGSPGNRGDGGGAGGVFAGRDY